MFQNEKNKTKITIITIEQLHVEDEFTTLDKHEIPCVNLCYNEGLFNRML